MSKFRIKFHILAVLILITSIPREPGLFAEDQSLWVNDIHASLNETRVNRIVKPESTQDIQEIVKTAAKEGRAISIVGSRHAMGGQQFGEDTILME